MKTVLKKITAVYYLVYFAALLAATSGYFILKSGFRIDPQSELGILINSLLIVFIIGSVPLTLWIFSLQTKKWAKLSDVEVKLKKYQKGAIISLTILGSGLVLGVVFYYILGIQSMILSAGIAAIGMFFCKPTEAKILTALDINEPEE